MSRGRGPVSRTLYGATRRAAGSMDRWLKRVGSETAAPPDQAPEPLEPPVSQDLLDLLRHLGVALIRSGETTGRVQDILDDLAHRYDVDEVHFFVLPTGVFVRVQDSRGSAVDLLEAASDTLRLDQIASLYQLIDRIKKEVPPPSEATAALVEILASPQPTPVWRLLLGNVVLTVGLGLMLNPTSTALLGYIVLGLVVQVLIMAADRFRLLSTGLPVVAGAVVTLLSFGFPNALGGGNPSQLLVPSVSSLLPGSALTNGSIELATGSMVAGASRTIYGFNKLLLLAFGILIGLQLLGTLTPATPPHSGGLGWWTPALGVLLIGLGHSWRASAPKKSLGWLLIVLYAAFCGQQLGQQLHGGGLLGSFLGGMIAVPVAYLVQRSKDAPPTQVVFLPAFWMLVPGGMGLTGVSELVTKNDPNGLHVVVNAVLTVLAIAMGVLVGSGLVASTRRPRLENMVEGWLGPDTGRHAAINIESAVEAESQRTTGSSEPGSASQSSQ
ncbi:threonine/serine exporter family protein [Nocardia sp. CDC153]|uniref:threonine/serine ThrE exporter family protein n=1 Tax=Nocardia sp. CDC153 TaxID=3112167 RepID=UPI002DBD39E9|nr:threonine/serine exporter family protein [Nocardia sp. CDC153]MEC3958153.1 threonine/serine exporter family protein [Nocardia sp. CDC153]